MCYSNKDRRVVKCEGRQINDGQILKDVTWSDKDKCSDEGQGEEAVCVSVVHTGHSVSPYSTGNMMGVR